MIKIIRLLSGEDIIAETIETETSYIIKNPVMFLIYYDKKTETQELLMNLWISKSIILEEEIELEKSKTLITMTPKPSFKEYYLNFIKTLEESTASDKSKPRNLSNSSKEVVKIH